jgi:hypothetical protein
MMGLRNKKGILQMKDAFLLAWIVLLILIQQVVFHQGW